MRLGIGSVAMVELAKIERVDLREIWESEPQDFTPWLGNHMSELGEDSAMPETRKNPNDSIAHRTTTPKPKLRNPPIKRRKTPPKPPPPVSRRS